MKKYIVFKPILPQDSPDLSNKIGETDDLVDAFPFLDNLDNDDGFTCEGLRSLENGFVYDVATTEFFGRNEYGVIQKLVISDKISTEIQEYFSAD